MSEIRDFLQSLGAMVAVQSRKEAFEFERRWLETFANNVKNHHGKWVYRGLRWHGFSYELQPCQRGRRAMEAYLAQRPAAFVVFDEEMTEFLFCESESYPDLSPLGRDVYISHVNLEWTMVFTHEQPHLGPYFAIRDDV